MDFETNTIELSLPNAKTGRALTASVYDVTFDDGSMRTMSIAQLVMAICLERATKMEELVISLMEEMANSTTNIDALSDIELKIVELQEEGKEVITTDIKGEWSVSYIDKFSGKPRVDVVTTASDVLSYLGVDPNEDPDTIIENIESKLDELNTNSQEQMIMLQSYTNKRDQSYEMISNIVKSLYTVLNGIVNNC